MAGRVRTELNGIEGHPIGVPRTEALAGARQSPTHLVSEERQQKENQYLAKLIQFCKV